MQLTQHPTLLHILQINLNKSKIAHLDLISYIKGKDWDIILIQEPHITNKFNTITTPPNDRPIFPENQGRDDTLVRSISWVSKALKTQSWENINVLGTNNITAIQFKGSYGKITIFNIYNDCNHPRMESML